MLTKLERARQLRNAALQQAQRGKELLALNAHGAVAAALTELVEEHELEAEMYGDLIAKYEAMQEETI